MGEEDQERERSRCDDRDVGSDDGGEGNVVARIHGIYGIWDMVQVYMPMERIFQTVSFFGFLLSFSSSISGAARDAPAGLLLPVAIDLDGVARPGGGFARRRR
jgi:hypothetical protein